MTKSEAILDKCTDMEGHEGYAISKKEALQAQRITAIEFAKFCSNNGWNHDEASGNWWALESMFTKRWSTTEQLFDIFNNQL